MEVALLNVQVKFQKCDVKADDIGNRTKEWTDFYTCFATVSGEGGKEKNAIGLTLEDSDIAFTIRYCKKAMQMDSTSYRIIFRDDIYNVLSIDHMNYKRKCIKFRCKKVGS